MRRYPKAEDIMDERDLRIQRLTQDVAKWKGRALEAAARACDECSEYMGRNCDQCRIKRIKEDAEK